MEATKIPTPLRVPKCLKLVTFPTGPYDKWTAKERTLMEAHASTWASEYVKDFDAHNTAIRLGFDEDDIKVAVKRYMKHWLVQAYIIQLQEQFMELNIATKDRLVASAFRDATDFSPRSDPRSRTTAQKTLSTLLGLDVKQKHVTHDLANGGDGTSRGGVMLLPAVVSLAEWEAKASESQRALKEEVRK